MEEQIFIPITKNVHITNKIKQMETILQITFTISIQIITLTIHSTINRFITNQSHEHNFTQHTSKNPQLSL